MKGEKEKGKNRQGNRNKHDADSLLTKKKGRRWRDRESSTLTAACKMWKYVLIFLVLRSLEREPETTKRSILKDLLQKLWTLWAALSFWNSIFGKARVVKALKLKSFRYSKTLKKFENFSECECRSFELLKTFEYEKFFKASNWTIL